MRAKKSITVIFPERLDIMQPKVSIVIPCYNKADYISNMFDSIIAQKWDNIEIIMVNDGSTDGTREIIAAYVPKFAERGFETIVVDQENRGVAAAVYEGFKRFTGEYVCQIDADDELDPEYVSVLAGWLVENHEYEWAVCDMLIVREDQDHRRAFYSKISESAAAGKLAECYLLAYIPDTVHEHIVRADYLRRSGLVDNYYHETRRTQEPQFLLPLNAANGKLKHIARPLYRHIMNPTMRSFRRSYPHARLLFEQYCETIKGTIIRMDLPPETKTRFLALEKYTLSRRLLQDVKKFGLEAGEESDRLCNLLLEFVNSVFLPAPGIDSVSFDEAPYLLQAVGDNILGLPGGVIPSKPAGRLIAWGALGERGRRLLPFIAGTMLEPDELWDIAGDGISVKRPEPGSLDADDLVLVLPINDVAEQICAALQETGCSIMLSEVMLKGMARFKYPQFYDGSLTFSPEGA
jgi:glycosyltransferase involved in cell wall biosynthesis